MVACRFHVSLLCTVLVGQGSRLDPAAEWLGSIARHPLRWLKTLWPLGWSRRTVMLLVMQSLDNAIALRASKALVRRGYRLRTEQHREQAESDLYPAANPRPVARQRTPAASHRATLLEALGNIPTTAHLLGGAVIGADASRA